MVSYTPFHKTLPKSSLEMHKTSVRFKVRSLENGLKWIENADCTEQTEFFFVNFSYVHEVLVILFLNHRK